MKTDKFIKTPIVLIK